MICPKCRLNSGKEWRVLCPTSEGGCGYELNFIQYLIYGRPILGIILVAYIIVIIIVIIAPLESIPCGTKLLSPEVSNQVIRGEFK